MLVTKIWQLDLNATRKDKWESGNEDLYWCLKIMYINEHGRPCFCLHSLRWDGQVTSA